jgi:hypothetical protein
MPPSRVSKPLLQSGTSRVARVASRTKVAPSQPELWMCLRAQLMISISRWSATNQSSRRQDRGALWITSQEQFATSPPVRVVDRVLLLVALSVKLFSALCPSLLPWWQMRRGTNRHSRHHDLLDRQRHIGRASEQAQHNLDPVLGTPANSPNELREASFHDTNHRANGNNFRQR